MSLPLLVKIRHLAVWLLEATSPCSSFVSSSGFKSTDWLPSDGLGSGVDLRSEAGSHVLTPNAAINNMARDEFVCGGWEEEWKSMQRAHQRLGGRK